MKNILVILTTVLLVTTTATAQEWHTDLTTAKGVAAEENKTIILVFQGSDWCAPCIKLDRQVWSTEDFTDYASDHFVMLQADFPRKKKNALPKDQAAKNAILAETYNRNGIFPLVVVMDATGTVLGETSYKKISPKAYINELNAFIK